MRDDDAAEPRPKAPEYGTPTGADAVPLYGSSDSVVPIEPAVADFDPRAEQRKKARAAAGRLERRRRVAREAKAAAARQANRARREAARDRTQDAHAAAWRRRAERAGRRRAAPPAWLEDMQSERQRRFEESEAGRRRARAVESCRARIAGVVVASVLLVGGITAAVAVDAVNRNSPVTASGLDWRTYPGYDSTELENVAEGPTQEETVAASSAMLDELRAAITEESGIEWTRYGVDTVTAQKNAWEGPSMLNDWSSARWYSTGALTSLSGKKAVIARVRPILEANGYTAIYLLNDPAQLGNDELVDEVYGGRTLATQVVWVLSAHRFDGSASTFDLRITDLTKDADGQFARRAESRASSGEIPVNSIVIDVKAYDLLPADEGDEFARRAEPFKGEEPPPIP
jgi:hypothetical protein